MSNLVPLHIDKETGRIVAGQTNDLIPVSGAFGYMHHQTTDAASWVITHGGGTTGAVIQTFDAQMKSVIPDEINIRDINTVEVVFTQPTNGFANIILFRTPIRS